MTARVISRDDLARLVMYGKDPVRMLQGLITNDLTHAGPARAVYGVMLTPKGRCIADLRALVVDTPDGREIWMDLPREVLDAATAHMRRFVPPMYARWRDVSAELGVLGIYGPEAKQLLERVLAAPVPALDEDAVEPTTFGGEPVTLIGSRYTGEPGFDVLADRPLLERLREALLAGGGEEIDAARLEALRIEAGSPRGGHELTEATIPTEAFEPTGLMERAISFSKGCYTGQEVIVRIAHRGHVNRHLRRLRLSEAGAAPGTRLFGGEKDVGWVSSVAGDRALGFVRRDVPSPLRVGSPDGPEAQIL